MRTIERTTPFRRDYKREKRAGWKGLDARLAEVVELLVADKPLPAARYDHPLTGKWDDCRECHLRPDVLLIYRKRGDLDGGALELVALGSHSELFG